METPLTPAITSFVIRFIHNEGQNPQNSPLTAGLLARGTIRNVQTNEEIDFTRWEDAVQFIERFVSLVENSSYTSGQGSESQAEQDPLTE
jgi:hypothetical protein